MHWKWKPSCTAAHTNKAKFSGESYAKTSTKLHCLLLQYDQNHSQGNHNNAWNWNVATLTGVDGHTKRLWSETHGDVKINFTPDSTSHHCRDHSISPRFSRWTKYSQPIVVASRRAKTKEEKKHSMTGAAPHLETPHGVNEPIIDLRLVPELDTDLQHTPRKHCVQTDAHSRLRFWARRATCSMMPANSHFHLPKHLDQCDRTPHDACLVPSTATNSFFFHSSHRKAEWWGWKTRCTLYSEHLYHFGWSFSREPQFCFYLITIKSSRLASKLGQAPGAQNKYSHKTRRVPHSYRSCPHVYIRIIYIYTYNIHKVYTKYIYLYWCIVSSVTTV